MYLGVNSTDIHVEPGEQKFNIKYRLFSFAAAMLAVTAHGAPHQSAAAAVASIQSVHALLQSKFDNSKQVAAASAASDEHPAPSHRTFAIELTAHAERLLWCAHLVGAQQGAVDAAVAMELRKQADGSLGLIRYYALKRNPALAAADFDPHTGPSLEPCALRGTTSARRLALAADRMPWVVVATRAGPQRVLFAVALERDATALQVHLYFGAANTRIDARKVS